MLRSNVKCMIVFCDHFLPCVVGKKRWKLQINQGIKLNSIVSVSDEAFALLLLENYWESMHNMDEDDFYKPKKLNAGNAAASNTTNSGVEVAKSSNAGKWTGAWRGARRYSGWKPEGLQRFNELATIVTENRKQDLHFEAQYKIHLRKQMTQKVSKNCSQPSTTVAVYRDLDSLGV